MSGWTIVRTPSNMDSNVDSTNPTGRILENVPLRTALQVLTTELTAASSVISFPYDSTVLR